MTPFLEKTFRFLEKSENPAAVEVLQYLLNSSEHATRRKAFEGLYLKRQPSIYLDLFHLIYANEKEWQVLPFLTAERMSRIAEEAIRSDDAELVKQGCDMAIRNRLYETLPAVAARIEAPNAEQVMLSTEMMLKLANCFYHDLVNAPNDLERRNMDRRREWFASQLEQPVRRYVVHNRIEPIKAYLLIAKKNYPFLLSVLADIHSQTCKTVIDLLTENDDGSYYRLLLGFIDDINAPPVIDIIIASKQEKKFVSYFLKAIGPNPSQTMKDALKRFKSFSWVTPGNPQLPELIADFESCFVQLIAHASLPREMLIAMLELVFHLPSVEGRQAAAQVIRRLNGDDVKHVLLFAAKDSDPQVCSRILKIMKSRRMKEADHMIMQNIDNPSELVRKTIYDLMPEFRIESFMKKMDQMPESMAFVLGHVIRNIDMNAPKRIHEDIMSTVPFRRQTAIDAIRYMNLGEEYQEILIHCVENDDEVQIRIAACMALAQVLTADSYQALQRASFDRNVMVQRAAVDATNRWQQMLQLQKQ